MATTRFFTEMAMYALDVLCVVTLVPTTRRALLLARYRRARLGVSILLSAAAGHAFMGNPEVRTSSWGVVVLSRPMAVVPSSDAAPDDFDSLLLLQSFAWT